MTTSVQLPANLPPQFQLMINTLKELATPEDGDDSLSTSIQIAESILEQTTEEAIFAAANGETVSGKNYIDEPFWVRARDIQGKVTGDQYKDEGGFPFYALCRARDEEGNWFVLNCGGESVVPTLFRLWDVGAIERYGDDGMPLIFKTVTTGAGHKLIKLYPYAKAKK